jgi:hypothetical protein
VLRAAVAAYLGRYRGQTLLHTESDLRIFLRWCADQGLDRWLQSASTRRWLDRADGG